MERAYPFHTVALWGLLMAGCATGPVPDATELDRDRWWRLHTLGEGRVYPSMEDSVLLALRVSRVGEGPGSVYSSEGWYAVDSDLRDLILRMRSGDSATAYMRKQAMPWHMLREAPVGADTGWFAIDLVLRRIRSAQESADVAQALQAAYDMASEDSTLQRYIRKHPRKWRNVKDVLCAVDSTKGHGGLARYGEQVALHFSTRTLDGRLLDDTRRADAPLTWRLGDPDQVVEGLEIAVQLLRVGDKGSFVVPSTMAFGHKGSHGGIVPPLTPLVFEVERMPIAVAAP